jgi:hypothetical protein
MRCRVPRAAIKCRSLSRHYEDAWPEALRHRDRRNASPGCDPDPRPPWATLAHLPNPARHFSASCIVQQPHNPHTTPSVAHQPGPNQSVPTSLSRDQPFSHTGPPSSVMRPHHSIMHEAPAGPHPPCVGRCRCSCAELSSLHSPMAGGVASPWWQNLQQRRHPAVAPPPPCARFQLHHTEGFRHSAAPAPTVGGVRLPHAIGGGQRWGPTLG